MIFFNEKTFCNGKNDFCDSEYCVIDGKWCEHFDGTGTNVSDIICGNGTTRRKGGLTMNGEHPCNICENKNCEEFNSDEECVWKNFWSESYKCLNYDCMLNYEGSCNGSFYGRCGCQK